METLAFTLATPFRTLEEQLPMQLVHKAQRFHDDAPENLCVQGWRHSWLPPLPLCCLRCWVLASLPPTPLRTLLFPMSFSFVWSHGTSKFVCKSVHFVNTNVFTFCLSLMLLIPKGTNNSSVGELSCFVNLFLRKGNWHLNSATIFLIRRKVRRYPVRIFKNPSHSILFVDNYSITTLNY